MVQTCTTVQRWRHMDFVCRTTKFESLKGGRGQSGAAAEFFCFVLVLPRRALLTLFRCPHVAPPFEVWPCGADRVGDCSTPPLDAAAIEAAPAERVMPIKQVPGRQRPGWNSMRPRIRPHTERHSLGPRAFKQVEQTRSRS